MLAEQVVANAINSNFFWMCLFWGIVAFIMLFHGVASAAMGISCLKKSRANEDPFDRIMALLLINLISLGAEGAIGYNAGLATARYIEAKTAPTVTVSKYAAKHKLIFNEETNRLYSTKLDHNLDLENVKKKIQVSSETEAGGTDA